MYNYEQIVGGMKVQKVVDGASGLMQSKSISVLCFLPLFLLSKRFK